MVYLQFFKVPFGIFPYFMAVVHIVLDKCIGIYMGIAYRSFWTAKKAVGVILGTWIIGILVTISCCVAYRFKPSPA